MIKKNKTIMISIAIAVAVMILLIVTVFISGKVIVASEDYTTMERQEKLSDEIFDRYNAMGMDNITVLMYYNKNNENSMNLVEDTLTEHGKILEIYINFDMIEVKKPVSAMIPGFDSLFETDTHRYIEEFCKERDIDYRQDAISDMSGEMFSELMEELRSITGVSL